MSDSLRRFMQYARPYWHWIAGATLCGVLKFSLALMLPYSLGWVIDEFLSDEPVSYGQLYVVLGLLVVAFIMRGFFAYFRSLLAAQAGHRTIFDIRRTLYRHMQRLSLRYHAERRTGETISRLINDLNQCAGILNQGVVAIGMDITFLVGVAAVLFVMDWRLASVSLVTLPVYGVVFRTMNPRLRAAARDVQEEMEDMSGEVTEKLAGLPVVISHVRERTEEYNFFKRHRSYYQKLLHRIRIRTWLTSIAEFLQSFGPIVVISYGGYLFATGRLSPGSLVTFYGFLTHLYLPTRRLADYSAQMQERLAALDRVMEVLDSDPDIQDQPGAAPMGHCQGHIALRDVTFAYGDEPVLRDINLEVDPGESVAFVGRSGAGKTTLVQLVPRFYDVQQGSVRIDGRDVRDVTVRSLREHIGFVLQESILFSGTIRENIRYGKPGSTDADMVRAARMAHVAEFVEQLPDGYDTVIGERGVSLSGGQRQRLSIARAFLRDPEILILDEATSNLDSGAETIIQDALDQLMKGRTTLIIAHRLSTIVDCDRVVVLQDGRVVQQGPHHELIGQSGLYRELCEEQFGGVGIEALG